MNILMIVATVMVCVMVFILLINIEHNIIYAGILASALTIIQSAFWCNILAIIGLFNSAAIFLTNLTVAIILFIIAFKKKLFTKREIVFDALDFFIVMIIVIVGIFLVYRYRICYVLGDRDPFCYFSFAKRLAEKGQLGWEVYKETGLPNLEKITYWTGSTEELVDYGFLPFSTVLFAIGYLIGGYNGLSMINPLLTILSMCVVYVFVSCYFKKRSIAVIVSVLLLCNPATLWNGRVTQSEVITQIIFFTFLILFFYAQKYNSEFIGNVAVIFLSCAHLARIDMYVCGIGMSCYLIYNCVLRRPERQRLFYNYILYQILMVAMFCIGGISTPTYILSQWEGGPLKWLFLATLLLIVVTSLVYILAKRYRLLESWEWNNRILSRWIIVVGMLAVIFIRFIWGKKYFFEWFCNYSSLVLFVFMIIGIAIMVKNNEWEDKLLFFIICGGNLVLYLYAPNIAWDNLWISRRWFTICLPFIMVCGVYGVYSFLKNKAVCYIILASLLCVQLSSCKGFLFVDIQKDLLASEVAFSNLLEKDKLYFTDEKKIYYAMCYLFEENVFQFASDKLEKKNMKDYLEQYKQMYYIGDIERLENSFSMEFEYEMINEYTIEGGSMERLYEEIPIRQFYYSLPSNIYLITGIRG